MLSTCTKTAGAFVFLRSGKLSVKSDAGKTVHILRRNPKHCFGQTALSQFDTVLLTAFKIQTKVITVTASDSYGDNFYPAVTLSGFFESC